MECVYSGVAVYLFVYPYSILLYGLSVQICRHCALLDFAFCKSRDECMIFVLCGICTFEYMTFVLCDLCTLLEFVLCDLCALSGFVLCDLWDLLGFVLCGICTLVDLACCYSACLVVQF